MVPYIGARRVEPHSSFENEKDSSDSDSDKENKKNDKIKFINREEVYIIENNLEIFKAKYEETEPLKSFVHRKLLRMI